MNKRNLLLSDFLIFVLTFVVFFSFSLSTFLVAQTDCYQDVESFSTETVSLIENTQDYAGALSKYEGLTNFRVSYFEEGSDIPTSDSLGSYDEETSISTIKDHLNKDYFEYSSSLKENFCYRVEKLNDSSIYIRFGIVVPSTYYLTKGYLIYGSLAVLLLDCVYVILTHRIFKKSFLALKSQIKKLQAITNPDRPIEYDDNLEFLALMIRDTRKELDEQFREAKTSEQKINFILDSFSQGLIVIDAECRIVMFNKKASEIFRLPKDSAEGRDLAVLGKVGKIEKSLSVVVKTLIPMVYYETIDGRIYECDINPIDYSWTRVNEKSGASMLLIDVTENFNSQKMKRDFFDNASHELKSPLTSILGYQEMIRDHIVTSTSEREDAVNKTISEAMRMKKIIMNMLELSSLENEDLRPVEKINVSKDIDSIISSLEVEAKQKQVTIVFTRKDMFLSINPDDFDRLMRNLIENAIKYNVDNGRINISVDPNKKTIVVSDTGIGISEENKSRIFERFFRVDKARSRQNGGTGLGLSIVKYICNYYDYSIDVTSELGEGSTFTIHTK